MKENLEDKVLVLQMKVAVMEDILLFLLMDAFSCGKLQEWRASNCSVKISKIVGDVKNDNC